VDFVIFVVKSNHSFSFWLVSLFENTAGGSGLVQVRYQEQI